MNMIFKEYYLEINTSKTKTVALKVKNPIRTKIVIDNIVIEQVKEL